MSEYYPALIVLVGATALVVGLYVISGVMAPSHRLLRSEPFLSGEPSTEHAVSRFHLRWYTVTLIFLLGRASLRASACRPVPGRLRQ